jgi:hypothetical protein
MSPNSFCIRAISVIRVICGNFNIPAHWGSLLSGVVLWRVSRIFSILVPVALAWDIWAFQNPGSTAALRRNPLFAAGKGSPNSPPPSH